MDTVTGSLIYRVRRNSASPFHLRICLHITIVLPKINSWLEQKLLLIVFHLVFIYTSTYLHFVIINTLSFLSYGTWWLFHTSYITKDTTPLDIFPYSWVKMLSISKIFKLFFWIITIKKNVAVGSSFSLIFKLNYKLTEISRRINVGFVFQRGITPLLIPPLTPQNQVRDHKQEAARSYLCSYQTNTAKRVTKFIPDTGRSLLHVCPQAWLPLLQTCSLFSWKTQEDHSFYSLSILLGKQHLLNYFEVLQYQSSLHNIKIKICFLSLLCFFLV